MESGDPACHIAGIVQFSGDLYLHALRASLNEVVRRQESLRTTFREVNGRIEQIISPAGSVDLEILPTDMSYGGAAESSLDSSLAAIIQRPFDLVRGPLLRAVLLKGTGNVDRLVVVIHHIISDGWSWMVLIREITELYKAFVTGTTPQLPTLSIQI